MDAYLPRVATLTQLDLNAPLLGIEIEFPHYGYGDEVRDLQHDSDIDLDYWTVGTDSCVEFRSYPMDIYRDNPEKQLKELYKLLGTRSGYRSTVKYGTHFHLNKGLFNSTYHIQGFVESLMQGVYSLDSYVSVFGRDEYFPNPSNYLLPNTTKKAPLLSIWKKEFLNDLLLWYTTITNPKPNTNYRTYTRYSGGYKCGTGYTSFELRLFAASLDYEVEKRYLNTLLHAIKSTANYPISF